MATHHLQIDKLPPEIPTGTFFQLGNTQIVLLGVLAHCIIKIDLLHLFIHFFLIILDDKDAECSLTFKYDADYSTVPSKDDREEYEKYENEIHKTVSSYTIITMLKHKIMTIYALAGCLFQYCAGLPRNCH